MRDDPRRLGIERSWPVLGEDEPDEGEKKSPTAPFAVDLLKKERTILISEEVSPKLTQRILGSVLWLESQSHDPIRVYLNTPGGSADDGFAIFDVLRYVKSPIKIVTLGLNASAGIIILLSAPRERRFALPSTRLMMHQPSGGGRGQSSDIEITANEILKLRHKANVLIAEETGKAVEDVERHTDRDYWLSAQEALDYGLVGSVVHSIEDVTG